MRPRSLILCALLLLAACGGSPAKPAAPSLQALVTRANAICATTSREMASFAPPAFAPRRAKARDLPVAAVYLDRVIPLLEDEQSRIVALGTPTTGRDLHALVLSALRALVADDHEVRDAAHAGRVARFRAALTRQQADATRLSGVAVQFGLTTCAQG
jgi:hypothetical protein